MMQQIIKQQEADLKQVVALAAPEIKVVVELALTTSVNGSFLLLAFCRHGRNTDPMQVHTPPLHHSTDVQFLRQFRQSASGEGQRHRPPAPRDGSAGTSIAGCRPQRSSGNMAAIGDGQIVAGPWVLTILLMIALVLLFRIIMITRWGCGKQQLSPQRGVVTERQ